MQDPRKQAITKAADEIRQTLGAKLNRRITDLDKIALNSKKHLPKSIRKSIKEISEAEENLQHRPYVSPQLLDKVKKEKNKVSAFASELDLREERRSARKRWITSLFLNYSGFLLLMLAFWYIATQM